MSRKENYYKKKDERNEIFVFDARANSVYIISSYKKVLAIIIVLKLTLYALRKKFTFKHNMKHLRKLLL